MLQCHLVVGRIDLHQHRARRNVLIVVYVYSLHRAAHARGDGNNVSFDLCVVRGLDHRIVVPYQDHAGNDGHRQHAEQHLHERTLVERLK